ncbi:MAG: hypothetical protein HKN10_11940 [Myxococcales bacterium]|nr:hypothetical protein [Myxococcales bacterium]
MLSVVPLDSLRNVRFPWYTADGSRILASAESDEFTGTQIVSFQVDGSGIQCLTCDVWTDEGTPLLKPIAFRDGARAMLRVGAQTPVTPADHAVLECSPSVTDCQTAMVIPIVPAAADDDNVLQDQREFRPAPDGTHVAFSQTRASASGTPEFVGLFGELVLFEDRYEVRNARVVSERVEIKQFTNDGAALIVTRFTDGFEAANPDNVLIDLATGEETRVTYALDYDEPLEYSPDGQWFVVGSGRGAGLFETVSQVKRPGFINPGIETLFSSLFLNRNPELLEPWLVDRYGARGDYIGQRLNPGSLESGWNARSITNWKPDGTAVVTWESRLDDSSVTRVVVIRLPDRTPLEIGAPPEPSPTPTWAPAAEGFVPEGLRPQSSRDGAVSGTAEITFTEGEPNTLEVVYTNFSDDGDWVVGGVERSEYTPGLAGSTTYNAELTLSGAHTGFLRAEGVLITAGAIGPAITSEVDGRQLELSIP